MIKKWIYDLKTTKKMCRKNVIVVVCNRSMAVVRLRYIWEAFYLKTRLPYIVLVKNKKIYAFILKSWVNIFFS